MLVLAARGDGRGDGLNGGLADGHLVDPLVAVAKGHGAVHAHGHEEERQVDQRVLVHLPRGGGDALLPQHADAVPEKPAAEEERRERVEEAQLAVSFVGP